MSETDFEPTDEPLRERLGGWFALGCIAAILLVAIIGATKLIQGWQENSAERQATEVQILEDLDVEIIAEPDIMWDRYVVVAGTCTVNVAFEEDTLEFDGTDIRHITTPRDITDLSNIAGLEGCF